MPRALDVAFLPFVQVSDVEQAHGVAAKPCGELGDVDGDRGLERKAGLAPGFDTSAE